jgi:hypothetical protein
MRLSWGYYDKYTYSEEVRKTLLHFQSTQIQTSQGCLRVEINPGLFIVLRALLNIVAILSTGKILSTLLLLNSVQHCVEILSKAQNYFALYHRRTIMINKMQKCQLGARVDDLFHYVFIFMGTHFYSEMIKISKDIEHATYVILRHRNSPSNFHVFVFTVGEYFDKLIKVSGHPISNI